MRNNIIIKGASEHNLKNINLELPRDKFIVFTGLSGSGKSSLAFDTIYAEGQRRYAESLSSYARQFLGRFDKPKVEFIDGLSPTISIDQKTTSYNPRSTVGTVTEIYDYLRLLFARVGIVHCPKCGKVVKKQSITQICSQILNLPEGTKILVMAPVIRDKKGEHVKLLEDIRKNGYVRVKIDNRIYELDEEIKLAKTKKHSIEIVVDRLIIRNDVKKRLTDSLETASKLSDGLINIEYEDKILAFSQNFSCPDCQINIQEIEPRSFSFNNPFGACPECSGLGFKSEFDPDLLVPNENLSLIEGAINVPGWLSVNNDQSIAQAILRKLAEKYNFDLYTPYKNLPQNAKNILMNGDNTKYKISFVGRFGKHQNYEYKFDGLINIMRKRYNETSSAFMRQEYESLMTNTTCPACNGQRLKKELLAVTVGGKNIYEVSSIPICDMNKFFEGLQLTANQEKIAQPILKEIMARVLFLQNVGLDYLTLSQSARSLSGGEAQRIRLAAQIGCGLIGVIYILDEPSIGLHQHDNYKLIKTLKKLNEIGNTLIVVEHDMDTIVAADYIVDIGPYAGVYGGEVLYCGAPSKIIDAKNSITGKYLSGEMKIEVPKKRRKFIDKIKIVGACENNLQNVDVEIPLKVFTCVTGVSGSGKSTLVNEILYKSLARDLNHAKVKAGAHKCIEGIEKLDKIINIDQSPIGRTPRSNPATYTGLFDLIRELFASVPEAKIRGYDKGRFSFNVKGGRCENCMGDGIIKIEMQFMPDVYVKCDECNGKRYNAETLEIKYKGKTISDLLDMTVDEAIEFFDAHPRIKNKLLTLKEVGLAYIKLGQSSTTLSGGEAQRVKLATELSKRSTGKTLYVLDEPTTGLHIYDVHKLIDILQKLTDAGNTVLVIEHNLDLIKTADYIIDLGPGGGDKGGNIVACGTPEKIAKNKKSLTGKYLAKNL